MAIGRRAYYKKHFTLMMIVGWATNTMTSSTMKLPYKATQFLFKYMKKSGGPPGSQMGHLVFLRTNQIAGKGKKIGRVAHPVSAVTTCFEKHILEGRKSQIFQNCFQNFLENRFLSELSRRVSPS